MTDTVAQAKGKLEYHVPKQYTEDRPAFIMTHAKHHQSIHEHPLACRLPRTTNQPTVFGERNKSFIPLITNGDEPKKLEDWIYTDRPPLSVHVVSFTDAILMTLTFSHTFIDAVGRQSLLAAWTAVLNGREEQVPPFVGYHEDPIIKLDGRTPGQKFALYDKTLSGFAFFKLVASVIWENVRYPETEDRTFCLPSQFVQDLRKQAMDDIAKTGDNFVSEGDVLFAWWAKTASKAYGFPSYQRINLVNVTNMRGVVDDVLPPDKAFIHNAATATNTWLRVADVMGENLGQTALRIRHSLLEQRSQEQMQAYISHYVQSLKTTGRTPMYGYPDEVRFFFSNWHKARFFDVDFSGAVTRTGLPLEQRANKIGRPSYINVTGYENGFTIRNGGPVIGKDAAGNWWLSWVMRKEAWSAVEKIFEDMARSENV